MYTLFLLIPPPLCFLCGSNACPRLLRSPRRWSRPQRLVALVAAQERRWTQWPLPRLRPCGPRSSRWGAGPYNKAGDVAVCGQSCSVGSNVQRPGPSPQPNCHAAGAGGAEAAGAASSSRPAGEPVVCWIVEAAAWLPAALLYIGQTPMPCKLHATQLPLPAHLSTGAGRRGGRGRRECHGAPPAAQVHGPPGMVHGAGGLGGVERFGQLHQVGCSAETDLTLGHLARAT